MGHVHQKMSVTTLLSKATSIERITVLAVEEALTPSIIFQALGAPFTIIKENGKWVGYICREDLFIELFHQKSHHTNFLRGMLSSIPMGVFVINRNYKIIHCNQTGLQMIKSTFDNVIDSDAGTIFNQDQMDKVFLTKEAILNQVHITNEFGILVDYIPITHSENNDNVMIIVQDLPKIEEMALEMEAVKNLNTDLQAILSSLYDEIIVTNDRGVILRHSDYIIPDFWETDVKQIVGKNLLDLEKEGKFSPSVTRLVLEKHGKVSVIQKTKNGKTVMAVGNPVFDENGNIHRIVIASRDITETTKLKAELQETRKLTKEYKEELEIIKSRSQITKQIIYCSPKMERVMHKIEKLSEFHSTVMVLGESGVGKELIARAIHKYGQRANAPFLALNCGAIPEELLESELFGYVKGAFTGANQQGKSGFFEKAEKGVLFLDEISELSLSLQVKLLRVLQEKEFTPVGSTQPIPVDVQIITATNKNIEKMVHEGLFREDLYYRLHVIPITIPPLRERPEDIPLLAYHFMQELNEQYGKSHHLSPDALNLLEAYSWPGNVRELQNLIERFVVFADEDIITADFIRPYMHFGEQKACELIITDIIPFKEAQQAVEEQLITLAMKRYQSTTKAAKVLNIDQSTVSRKYKKILERQKLS